ncbi:uncharacterized protein LOC122639154 [Telopea speciosissima]|uniref:uncharacterized protein LOC122639154 n=1 Tax=Telopea speciosissima TaxID=54955 RepID=UPI001CC5F225|nr:uncharacterized protein LOC122639154 [Telopea speciosissima]
MDPLKYLFKKPALTGRLARWLLLLAEFDIMYTTQKSIKGSAIAEHLSAHPVIDTRKLEDVFPDQDINSLEVNKDIEPWRMLFDGAANHRGCGAGVLFITPEGLCMPMSFRLGFDCTNNMAEYEACVLGLKVAISIGVKKLEHFIEINFDYFPRENNRFADALATLASMMDFGPRETIQPFVVDQRDSPSYEESINALTADGRPWYAKIVDFIKERRYPADATHGEKRFLRRYATQFVLHEDILYKRPYDGIQLVCIDEEQAQTVLDQVHQGICGSHMNAHMLAKKILRLGYYWNTMEADCVEYVRKCHKCQIFANLIHVPPIELHSLSSPWPFSTWGIDVIGKVTPKASNRHEFVLVAIDYFTKWVEAQSYAKFTAGKAAKFLEEHIICRHGMPQELISGQGQHFRGKAQELCDKFKIVRHRSSPYRPQTNGAVEAANKNMKAIL